MPLCYVAPLKKNIYNLINDSGIALNMDGYSYHLKAVIRVFMDRPLKLRQGHTYARRRFAIQLLSPVFS